MEEDIRPARVRQRTGWTHWVEDIKMWRNGVLDLRSLIEGRKKVSNPVTVEVRDADGNLKAKRYTHNLRTNDGADWQARLMAGGFTGFQQTNAAGVTITAPTGTTAGKITDTNFGAGITLNQYIGYVVVMGNVHAHIVGNSASSTNTVILYFDNWFSNSPGTTVAAPTAAVYTIVAANTPAFYIGLSSDTVAPAAADHLLASEITANGLGRAYVSGAYVNPNGYQHTAASNTYSVAHQWTDSTASTSAVQKCGMFTGFSFPNDAATDLANVGKGGGIMVFENTFGAVTLNVADTLTLTWQVTY